MGKVWNLPRFVEGLLNAAEGQRPWASGIDFDHGGALVEAE